MDRVSLNRLIDLVFRIAQSSEPAPMDLLRLQALLERFDPRATMIPLDRLLKDRKIPFGQYIAAFHLAKRAVETFLPKRKRPSTGTAKVLSIVTGSITKKFP